ncbi:PREDICTED: nitric oxide synthase-interacting protein-like [Camelina sativa]|uniref:Nitric oxide synthase-interacting protein-like n=1 Tax=Camelina sativa TaxID=90675 RepID=A0ABM0T5M9_CAMSA|nr:PREDICTED: nitric oxide synthase-interacting protein-like [Camelina sativa]
MSGTILSCMFLFMVMISSFVECILECFLAHNKDIQKRVAAHIKQNKDDEEEKLMLQKARELDDFDQENHSAMPRNSEKNHNQDKNGFHGANSVKTTFFEKEALRMMKAFWLPSATPATSVRIDAPETHTACLEGKKKLKLKNLFTIRFTQDNSEEDENKTKSSSSSSYKQNPI